MYWIWRNFIRKPVSLIPFLKNSETFYNIERNSDYQLLDKLNKKYQKNKSIIDLYENQDRAIVKEEA